MERIYAVVYRTTKSGDGVQLFREKAQAKVFIHQSLTAYVDAAVEECCRSNPGVDVKQYYPISEKIESYKECNGEGYSVYFGTCGGNYITSAKLLEKTVV